MKWIRRAAAAALPVAALVMLATGPVSATVKPGATYQMYGTSCANGPCGMRLTITSNPNNASVRAEVDCANGTTVYGGWHTAVGETSATPECGGGTSAGSGWEVWNMSQHFLSVCWQRPQNWNGSCT